MHLRQRNYIFYLRAATPDASAAPFIFTAATARTGNSRILSDEILGSSRRMTQGRNSSFRNSLYGIPKFAVAAVKTRLQDFRAIVSFKAAALAVGERLR